MGVDFLVCVLRAGTHSRTAGTTSPATRTLAGAVSGSAARSVPSTIRGLRLLASGTSVVALPPKLLAKRVKELERREAWVSSLYPEAVAQDVFDQLEEPPGTWAWHKDRPDDWNKRAEARWEALVAEYISAGERSFRG